MTQPTFTQVRAALAASLAAHASNADGSALRTTANRPLQVNPPIAVIMPVQGTLARYSVSMDGETDYSLRVILLVAPADSTQGEDILDPYIAASGPSSIWAAVQADPSLGGVVSYAIVTEATGYGIMNFTGIDYLAVSLIVTAGV
jgi:hypothetical protein